jgi:hypothetical protein
LGENQSLVYALIVRENDLKRVIHVKAGEKKKSGLIDPMHNILTKIGFLKLFLIPLNICSCRGSDFKINDI